MIWDWPGPIGDKVCLERDARPSRSDAKLWTDLLVCLPTTHIILSLFRLSIAVVYNRNKIKFLLLHIVVRFYFVGDKIYKELILKHNRLTGRWCTLRTNLGSSLICKATTRILLKYVHIQRPLLKIIRQNYVRVSF